MQLEPPEQGGGLVQVLIQVWLPVPQVPMQSVVLIQADQLPPEYFYFYSIIVCY